MVHDVRAICGLNSWILTATQIDALVITSQDEDLENHSHSRLLQIPLQLSTSTSVIWTIASTARDQAQYSLRADRVGETAHPCPILSQFSHDSGTDSKRQNRLDFRKVCVRSPVGLDNHFPNTSSFDREYSCHRELTKQTHGDLLLKGFRDDVPTGRLNSRCVRQRLATDRYIHETREVINVL